MTSFKNYGYGTSEINVNQTTKQNKTIKNYNHIYFSLWRIILQNECGCGRVINTLWLLKTEQDTCYWDGDRTPGTP